MLLVGMSSCTHIIVFKSKPGNSAHAPSQIKKMTGAKSAKAYAPGQLKKEKLSYSALLDSRIILTDINARMPPTRMIAVQMKSLFLKMVGVSALFIFGFRATSSLA